MTYYIEKSRNTNLEDTAIPNLFITDFMPDVPDGDFVKVYIYAYMCCRQGIALGHTELAEALGLELPKVYAAWRYFSDRHIVKIWPSTPPDDRYFDVEFVDVKGMLYTKEKPGSKGGEAGRNGAGALSEPALAALFQKLAVICGVPSIDGSDAQRVITWLEEDGATPEIVEYAYQFCREERGEKGAKYIEKVVKEWASKGLKTVRDVRDYRAKTDARSAVHKKLMEALGLRYVSITAGEEKIFNRWLDEYGYTPEELLEKTEKTVGKSNKLQYLDGIIRNERKEAGEAGGKGTGSGSGGGRPGSGGRRPGGKVGRDEYYRRTRLKNEELKAACREEVYAAAPEVRQTDEQLVALNIEIVKTLKSGMADKKSVMKRLEKEIDEVSAARREQLQNAGFAPDYTDDKYDCLKCHDTGMLENGSSCDCYAP